MVTRILATYVSALYLLSGCQSKPPVDPDNDPSSCQDVHLSSRHGDGLSAEKTTQLAAFFNDKVLIGGEPADPKDWPASVYARAGSSACSATVVGERSVLIAAHCVSNGGTIRFSAGSNSYQATCAHHPSYRGNSTADWSLCVTDKVVTGIPFENLGINEKLEVGQEVRLTGYGCIRPGGGGGNDGTFRIGKATVRSLPNSTNYDTVTRGGAALCFGDSGGAAYVEKQDGSRVTFGVNSRGDIRTESYLSSVFVATFRDWATSWASQNGNVRICGMHSDAIGCRDGGQPPLDRKFVVGGKAACVEGVVKPGFEEKKPEIKESVRRALNEF